jgi:Ca2+/Na+ antiporter
LLTLSGKDDIAGGVMMGAFIILVSAIIATAAAVFERTLHNAVAIKSKNELAV